MNVSKLRMVEWVLMLAMIYAFAFEAAPAAQNAVHDCKLSNYENAVEYGSLSACQVPEPYASELGYGNETCGVNPAPELDAENVTVVPDGR